METIEKVMDTSNLSSTWHSPQKIYTIGHRAVAELFNHDVQIQEKVDGSFFAFGLYTRDGHGQQLEDPELWVRSKGAVMHADAPPAMFRAAVEAVQAVRQSLTPNWQYRGEVLAKPKHNALAYDRVPTGNVILFDILSSDEGYLTYNEMREEAARLGFEVVPQLFSGRVSTADAFRTFLDTTSVLGGQKIEGVVAKPLTPVFDLDGKLLMAKFVGEAFKEVHRASWGAENPTKNDILDKLQLAYATPTRWQKAVQHLRERGELENSPRDIGKLIREVPADVFSECEDEMREILWKWAKPHVTRGLTRDLPLWYKEQLVSLQFEGGTATIEEMG